MSTTLGMRVMPPTRTSSSICAEVRSASFRQFLNGWMQRSKRLSQICSIFARVSCTFRCFGPEASAVMNGRLMSTDAVEDRAILAFSASSLRRWRAIGSLRRSMPLSFLKLSTSTRSAPRPVVTAEVGVAVVAFTSKTPSPISSTETSNVPPPRSNTAIFSSFFLSRP